MNAENKNPAAAKAADRGVGFVKLATADKPQPSQTACESLAVIIVAQRLGLTVTHARIVCHLAGIGGGHE